MSPSDDFALVDLAYPDAVDLAPLLNWERAVRHLAEQPPRVLARCEQRYAPPVLSHRNEHVREFANRFRLGPPDQCARVVCLGTVLERALVVMVKDAKSGEAFELKPLVWDGKALLVCHPLSLVLTGIFAPAVAQLPSASLSIRLSGGALYVPERQMIRIIADHQKASESEMKRSMERIVGEHEGAGQKIKHDDFMSRMERETGGGRRSIQSLWKLVPDHMKYMHRPRSR